MLIITRRAEEIIRIGDDVVVKIIDISGNTVRLGIEAPRSLPVYRQEVWEAVSAENRAAATTEPEALERAAAPEAEASV
ncbi:MAG: carbon storage regulator CsrA [Solirubrobacteraceae bacterium]